MTYRLPTKKQAERFHKQASERLLRLGGAPRLIGSRADAIAAHRIGAGLLRGGAERAKRQQKESHQQVSHIQSPGRKVPGWVVWRVCAR